MNLFKNKTEDALMFPRPRIVCSRCLGFYACRWNGEIISDPLVAKLRDYLDFITPCPEADIGLGVPREPIRIVRIGGTDHLIQPATDRDVTAEMNSFSESFLNSLDLIDGFLLKDRSPSCGTTNVKSYFSAEKGSGHLPTSGLFAAAAKQQFPLLPIESEGRLLNFRIREHFLTRIFTLARFRQVKEAGSVKALVEFQATHKELLRLYCPAEKEALGRIVANPDHKPLDTLLPEYESHLLIALQQMPSRGRAVNVLQHMLGYFSEKISRDEKNFFLKQTDLFVQGQLPISVCIGLILSWAIRFNTEYLLSQTFLMPYPQALIEITDSGKGRNF